MRLPSGHCAVVEIEKLRDYSLSREHEAGKHKARVFAATLGLGAEDAEWLRERILEMASTQPCQTGQQTTFGQLYAMDFDLAHAGQQARVRCAWIVHAGEEIPRLVSCYVLPNR